jgi:hypothetical protein
LLSSFSPTLAAIIKVNGFGTEWTRFLTFVLSELVEKVNRSARDVIEKSLSGHPLFEIKDLHPGISCARAGSLIYFSAVCIMRLV